MRLTEKPERMRSLLRLVIPGVVLVYASSAHAADVTLGIIGHMSMICRLILNPLTFWYSTETGMPQAALTTVWANARRMVVATPGQA